MTAPAPAVFADLAGQEAARSAKTAGAGAGICLS